MGKTKRQDTSESRLKSSLQKLKSVCRHQQKELARLRKELGRRDDISEEYRELISESKNVPITKEALGRYCPKCRAETYGIPLGIFTLVMCTECDWRLRQKL